MDPNIIQLLQSDEQHNVILGCYLARSNGYSDVEIVTNGKILSNNRHLYKYNHICWELGDYSLVITDYEEPYLWIFKKYYCEFTIMKDIYYPNGNYNRSRFIKETLQCKLYSDSYELAKKHYCTMLINLLLE